MQKSVVVKASADCKVCKGRGVVMDRVPYGSTTTNLVSVCDCVLNQLPEDDPDMEFEIEEADGYGE